MQEIMGKRLVAGSRTGWVIALVFVLFTAYHSYYSFVLMKTTGSLEGDQLQIGYTLLKQMNPALFARDLLFEDQSLVKLYTPGYMWLIRLIMALTGDYGMALVFLTPVVMLLYLAGMYALAFEVTKSRFIALLISLVSCFTSHTVAAEYWGAINVRLMVPRTLLLAFIPWLFLLAFRWLPGNRPWQLPLLALLAGLVGNLHPNSGLFFVQFLLGLILLQHGLSRKSLVNLALCTLAAAAGASPTLSHVLLQTEKVVTVPFEAYYQIVDSRLYNIFPGSRFSEDFGFRLSSQEQQVFVTLYLAFLCVWGLLFLLSLRRRPGGLSARWLYALLFTMQIPLAGFLTGSWGGALIAAATAYVACRLRQGEPDKWDIWLLGLLVLVGVYSLVVSWILKAIWMAFQAWPLTIWTFEQVRAVRFIYLPLYLYAALFLLLVLKQPTATGNRRQAAGNYLLAAALAYFFSSKGVVWVGLAGILAFSLTYERWRSNPWGERIRDAVTILLVVRALCGLLALPYATLWAVAAAVTYGAIDVVRHYSTLYWRLPAVVSLVATAILCLGPAARIARQIGPTLQNSFNNILPQPPWQCSGQCKNTLELYEWARTHTDLNSLFYVYHLQEDATGLPIHFRYHARRSVTHSWKDIGTSYYTKNHILEIYNNYREFQEAARDTGSLLAVLKKHDVDYVLTPVDKLQLPLPVAFENDSYRVYRYE
jgi:hypothetical protein